jgi:uncharacterized protein YqgV (UPF0045/DUF77 family)
MGLSELGGEDTVSMVSAQVSLYPLRSESLSPVIKRAIRILRKNGLDTRAGPMSTLVTGPAGGVFDALAAAFRSAADEG